MAAKLDSKNLVGRLVILIIAIFVTSFLVTGSFNPLMIYKSGSLAAKAAITILAALSLPTLIQALFVFRAALGWIVIFALAMLSIAIVTDDPAGDGRIKAAYDLLDDLKVSNSENEKAWGLSDFEVFADVRGFWINSPHAIDNDVVIPIWIRGINKRGVSGKWKIKLHVIVEKTGNGSSTIFKVKNYSMRETKALSWWEQLGRWLMGSLIAPILVASYFFSVNINFFDALQTGWGIVIFILGFLSITGYLAYVFFGSAWAVVLGVFFWIGLLVFIISTISGQ